MNKEIVKLSWEILEHKYRYYIQYNPIIEDIEYDNLEKRYIELCNAEGVEPTASNMVGFDAGRPCSQIISAKLEGIDYEIFNRIGYHMDSKKKKEKTQHAVKEKKMKKLLIVSILFLLFSVSLCSAELQPNTTNYVIDIGEPYNDLTYLGYYIEISSNGMNMDYYHNQNALTKYKDKIACIDDVYNKYIDDGWQSHDIRVILSLLKRILILEQNNK